MPCSGGGEMSYTDLIPFSTVRQLEYLKREF